MSNTEILREFLLETHENLALLDSDLVKLESHPDERSTLAQVFRTLHSVKGSAGFMGLVKLQGVTHAAENLLGRLRAGEIRLNQPMATALLQVVDAVREILASLETTGSEGDGDYAALTAEVDRLRETGGNPLATAVHSSHQTVITPAPEISRPIVTPPPGSTAVGDSAASDTALSGPQPSLEAASDLKAASVAETAIRVDVGLLDKLMMLVGELVLARNQILQQCGARDDRLGNVVQRLNALTTDLQASVMKTRMQPIGNVLGKFPRFVRDLAVACGKKVKLELDGEATELDKTLIEAIRDPLTHMIRNAIDHGIETPAMRVAQGKPEEGHLRVIAFHEGGKVIIEITDDGAGIDGGRVRDKALSAGLVTAESVSRLSPAELQRLVFLPGFSTAEQVTEVSGRGVGMDVVRTNIEQIGGTVDLESVPGQGTTIRTRIPLTLAIIPALMVEAGHEQFAIPQVSLLEVVRIDADASQAIECQKIEWLHGVPVYRLRGKLLPVVFLDEQLELATGPEDREGLYLVVLQADEQPFGLAVTAIRDTEEIVVKPLQQELKGISVFAGATIMGDGRIALVLDVAGIAERAHVLSDQPHRQLAAEAEPAPTPTVDTQSLLLFESTTGGRMAIPLAQVSRLEEFPLAALEKFGSRQVVRYRAEILPLIDVSQEFEALTDLPAAVQGNRHGGRDANDESVPVVVYANDSQRVGLIVGKILDVVHEPLVQHSVVRRPGTLWTAVIQERVTEIVDVPALISGTKSHLVLSTT